MKLALLALLVSFASTSAIVPPGADSPAFYLVASSASGGAGNLQPLRTDGGAGGYATLTGTGPIGQFYFYQGSLVAAPRPGSPPPPAPQPTQRPLIGSVLGSTGCSAYGSLGFTEGSSSNKCARYSSFYIQSDPENSQLGARLTFNYIGGFYACGSGQDVWYKTTPTEGPSDCTPIDLYTVPVN